MSLPSFERSLVFAIATTTLLACGGATDSVNTNQGGRDSTTTTSGGSVGAGGATSRGGNTATVDLCCNSRPYCRDGDVDLGSNASCPAGAECYLVPAVCCSPAIYCARSIGGASAGGASPGAGGTSLGGAASGGTGATANFGGNSNAGGWSWGYVSTYVVGGSCSAPPCATGYLPTGIACKPDDSLPSPCYSIFECGMTFLCRNNSATCKRTSEYNRRYQFADTTLCQTTSITCPMNTVVFTGACGCGCEQASTCTEWVDCMPGPTSQSPLCSDATLCPYTLRAL